MKLSCAQLVSLEICEACKEYDTLLHPLDLATRAHFPPSQHSIKWGEDCKQSYEVRHLPFLFKEFYAVEKPDITTHAFCERLFTRYTTLKRGRPRTWTVCSDETWVIALVLLERLLEIYPLCRISDYNVHRLLLVSLLIACKQHDDNHWNNHLWAKAGGVTVAELNQMERKLFLELVRHDACAIPTAHEFDARLSRLRKRYETASEEDEKQCKTDEDGKRCETDGDDITIKQKAAILNGKKTRRKSYASIVKEWKE